MIALWMLYALLLAMWLGLAASLIERVLRSLRLPARWVWLVAMLLSVVAPVLSAWLAVAQPRGEAGALIGHASAAVRSSVLWLDRVLVLGWAAAFAVLLVALLLAHRSVLRARRNWRHANVRGTPVLIAPDFGPGVLALGRAQIVLPAWALELAPELQELMLLHEREHLRVRDHWLILMGLLLLVLFPFNPLLWWQFTRLKLALEMDCDARVLSGRQDVREYAALLLDVGERSQAGRLVLAAFAAPPHAIERRIHMMLGPRPRSRRVATALCAAGAVVLIAFACEMPEPQSPEAAVRSALGVVPEPPPPPPAPPKGPTLLSSVSASIHVKPSVVENGPGPFTSANEQGEARFYERIVDARGRSVRGPESRADRLPPPPPPPPRR